MLTSAQRREILNAEYRKALANMRTDTGKLRTYQIAATKGIARKRALSIIDGVSSRTGGPADPIDGTPLYCGPVHPATGLRR